MSDFYIKRMDFLSSHFLKNGRTLVDGSKVVEYSFLDDFIYGDFSSIDFAPYFKNIKDILDGFGNSLNKNFSQFVVENSDVLKTWNYHEHQKYQRIFKVCCDCYGVGCLKCSNQGFYSFLSLRRINFPVFSKFRQQRETILSMNKEVNNGENIVSVNILRKYADKLEKGYSEEDLKFLKKIFNICLDSKLEEIKDNEIKKQKSEELVGEEIDENSDCCFHPEENCNKCAMCDDLEKRLILCEEVLKRITNEQFEIRIKETLDKIDGCRSFDKNGNLIVVLQWIIFLVVWALLAIMVLK